MNYTASAIVLEKVKVHNLLPEIGIEKARNEILMGLTARRKYISSKYFYDEKGSSLFEKITQLDEYYPTRTEKAILKSIAPGLMGRNASFEIMELGSGDCSKISILMNALQPHNLENVRYIPVDVSKSAVEKSVQQLSRKFPQMEINGYVADFTHQLNQVPHSENPRMVCFFGSTIGNFSADESRHILQNLYDNLLEGDSLLVGFDLVKPEPVLHAAYNDSRGVTEQFNKNILNVANEIAGFDFNPEKFEHVAFFNRDELRIEMHLKAKTKCSVSSPFCNVPLEFQKDESIHVENSHKYSFESIEELANRAKFKIRNIFTDSKDWFALVELGK